MNNNSNKFLGYVALFSLFGGAALIFSTMNVFLTQPNASTQKASVVTAISSPLDFSNTSVVAKAAYVLDVSKGEVIFSKNEQAQLPLASITKIALILLAYEHLDMNAFISVSANSLRSEGDWGFTIGESWNVRDLIDYTLMTSSNDGASILAEGIEKNTDEDIVTLLNKQAKSIGLTQTFFLNETGLDSSTALSGTYGSAQDVGTLFAYAYSIAPHIFSATTEVEATYSSTDGVTYEAVNTNKAISQIPGLVFGKTGFTDLAGGNLAVVTESEPGHPYVIIVLGSTISDRFDDIVTLTHATLREPGK